MAAIDTLLAEITALEAAITMKDLEIGQLRAQVAAGAGSEQAIIDATARIVTAKTRVSEI